MSFLARFRVLTKVLAVIVLMAIVACSISWIGMHALETLNKGADNMSYAAKRALEAARANQNVIAMNRAEFRVAVDPRAENRAEVHKVIEEQMKLLHERLDDVATTRDTQAKAMLPGIKEAISVYEKEIAETLRLADAVKDVQVNNQTERLRDAAMKSRAAAEDVRAKVAAVADRLNSRVEHYAHAAEVEYQQVSKLLMTVAGIGIVLGLAGGFLVGQFGIAKPMRALVGLLQQMAKGETVEMIGKGRGDEIGETARAVDEIKVMLAEKARQEAEAKVQQDQILAQQRKADMLKLADQFEGAVGEIIETVSSASTQLEASADRHAVSGTHNHGSRGLGGSLNERTVGSVSHGGAEFVRQRNQPPGAGIGSHGWRGRRSGAQD